MTTKQGTISIITALVLVSASIVTLFAVVLTQASVSLKDSAEKVYIDGVCSVEDGEWTPTVPGNMVATRFHHAVIRGRLSQRPAYGQKLAIVSTNVWYQFIADGYAVSNKRPDDNYPYQPFSNRDLSDLIDLYVVDDNGIYSLILKNQYFLLLTALIISSFGFFVFPIAGFVLGGINLRYLSFSVLSFVGGIHLIVKILYPYLPLWIHDPVLCMSLGEATIHIFCISMLLFIKVTLKEPRHGKISNLVLLGYTAVVVIVFLFSPLGVMDLYACKPISHIAYVIASTALTVCLFRELRTNKEAKHALITLLPITAALIFDVLNAYLGFINITFLELGTVLALAYQIVNLVIDLRIQYKEAIRYQQLQKELYESRVAIMVSQIQPHFLYNSLTSIAMMCSINPETAQEATITFAEYLRGNMDSLKQKMPVPFTKELEHLKKYLYIEKLRFGEDLNIEYDIQATDFMLPQLSIQPLVENAVKHGVGMKREGGTVTIATRETETAYEVIVSDDGVGFDTETVKNDGRSHVGMDNVRRRLDEMCGGKVEITSQIGQGTVSRVIIPKQRSILTQKTRRNSHENTMRRR